jgi:hypothetical protein
MNYKNDFKSASIEALFFAVFFIFNISFYTNDIKIIVNKIKLNIYI